MKNILGTGTEIMLHFFFVSIFVCLSSSVFGVLVRIISAGLFLVFLFVWYFFFLFPISLFNVIRFIKSLVYTNKKLGVVRVRSSSYKKMHEPYGGSDLTPYNMAYSCTAYSPLTVLFEGVRFYAFIQQFYSLELFC